jgi:hypothetical protein
VQVCPGEFQMGSPDGEADRGDDELRHLVEITRPFLLAATEVTQAEWLEVMEAAPAHFAACGDDCPGEMVSWTEVATFCNALSAEEGLEECPTSPRPALARVRLRAPRRSLAPSPELFPEPRRRQAPPRARAHAAELATDPAAPSPSDRWKTWVMRPIRRSLFEWSI